MDINENDTRIITTFGLFVQTLPAVASLIVIFHYGTQIKGGTVDGWYGILIDLCSLILFILYIHCIILGQIKQRIDKNPPWNWQQTIQEWKDRKQTKALSDILITLGPLHLVRWADPYTSENLETALYVSISRLVGIVIGSNFYFGQLIFGNITLVWGFWKNPRFWIAFIFAIIPLATLLIMSMYKVWYFYNYISPIFAINLAVMGAIISHVIIGCIYRCLNKNRPWPAYHLHHRVWSFWICCILCGFTANIKGGAENSYSIISNILFGSFSGVVLDGSIEYDSSTLYLPW